MIMAVEQREKTPPDYHEGINLRIAAMSGHLADGGTISWLNSDGAQWHEVIGVKKSGNRLAIQIKVGGRECWREIGGTFTFSWTGKRDASL
jgi:hypothetical protein